MHGYFLLHVYLLPQSILIRYRKKNHLLFGWALVAFLVIFVIFRVVGLVIVIVVFRNVGVIQFVIVLAFVGFFGGASTEATHFPLEHLLFFRRLAKSRVAEDKAKESSRHCQHTCNKWIQIETYILSP